MRELTVDARPPNNSETQEISITQADRDSFVMRIIGEEDLEGFTFEGLKRRMGTHSETLSRMLSRLEESGVLARTEHGYIVTERGKFIAGARQTASSKSGVLLLRTLMPAFQNNRMINGLMGRWFGPLRWLGYSRDETGTTMKWITENGSVQVDAHFSDGELVIEGRILAGSDLSEAIAASHQLVGYISRIYSHTPQRPAYSSTAGAVSLDN